MVPAIWPERVSHHPCAYPMTTTALWLPTVAAAQHLAVSPDTLKRRRDISGGYLVGGRHWRCSTEAPNSTLLWEVNSISAEFHKRGMRARVLARSAAVLLAEEET